MPELGVTPGMVPSEARIEVDGREEALLSAGLLDLMVEETTDGLFRCEARFGNWGGRDSGTGYLYLDRSLLEFGKDFVVAIGAGEGKGEVFRGRIYGLESHFEQASPSSVTVLAEDLAQDLRMVRRSRVFEDTTDATVFEQIASEHGLQSEIDAPGPNHSVLAQVNQSDLAFIRERARWLDAEVWVAGRTLHVQPRTSRFQGNQDLTLTIGISLLEFTVCADLARQSSKVVVSGWDVAAKEGIVAEATESALGSEVAGFQSGASILSSAIGERIDRMVQHVPLTSAEAEALAQAAFRAQARRFVSGQGRSAGDSRLRVGAKVVLRGVGTLFDGIYVVTMARHIFSRGTDGGYHTEFAVERAGVGQL